MSNCKLYETTETISKRANRLDSRKDIHFKNMRIIGSCFSVHYRVLYNNQIHVRTLIGQWAMGYCAGKPTEKSCMFWIII